MCGRHSLWGRAQIQGYQRSCPAQLMVYLMVASNGQHLFEWLVTLEGAVTQITDSEGDERELVVKVAPDFDLFIVLVHSVSHCGISVNNLFSIVQLNGKINVCVITSQAVCYQLWHKFSHFTAPTTAYTAYGATTTNTPSVCLWQVHIRYCV